MSPAIQGIVQRICENMPYGDEGGIDRSGETASLPNALRQPPGPLLVVRALLEFPSTPDGAGSGEQLHPLQFHIVFIALHAINCLDN